MNAVHNRFAVAIVIALGAASVVAGCGGSAAGPPAAPAAFSAPQSQARMAKATMTLAVPRAAAATGRRTQYVSVNANSLVVSVAGTILATTALAAPACVNGGSGTLACTVTFNAPVGTSAMTFATYASTNGSGTPLSLVTMSETIVANAVNTIALTLNGVPASVELHVDPPVVLVTSPPVAATVTVSLLARDASKALIVGPGAYADSNGNPLTFTLTSSDTTHAALSTTTIAAPGQTASIAFAGTAAVPTIAIGAIGGALSTKASLAIEGGPIPYPLAVSGTEQPVILNSPGPTLGDSNVPDGFFSVIYNAGSGTYTGWTAGIIGCAPGSTGVVTSTDMLHFTAVPTALPSPVPSVACVSPTTPQAQAVLGPTAYNVLSTVFDSEYAGPGTVVQLGAGRYVLIYHGENHSFSGSLGTVNSNLYEFYATVGIATSPDGIVWTRPGGVGNNAVIAAVAPMPSTAPSAGVGAAEPTSVIGTDGNVYTIYSEFFPNIPAPGATPTPGQFALAIAPAANVAPGGFTKWFEGAFTQPAMLPSGGVGGQYSALLPAGGGCVGVQRQGGLAYYQAGGVYVLVMSCNTAFAYAESKDLLSWTVPAVIPGAPALVASPPPCGYTYGHASLHSLAPPAAQYTIANAGWMYYERASVSGPSCNPTPLPPPGPHQMFRLNYTIAGP